MTKSPNAYFCSSCKKVFFLPAKSKTVCPECRQKLLSLDCSEEEFQNFTQEEQEIIIESNALREQKINERLQYAIENPDADHAKILQKIASDAAITKWSVIGFGVLFLLFYILEEFF